MNHLVTALLNPRTYPEACEQVTLIETHISWVFLTGLYAYKIKKPVNFGFIDYDSLEKRHHYCQLEFDLNQRLSSPLYLGVVPIHGSPDQPNFSGQGAIIEYALKMVQFDQQQLFSQRLQQGNLGLPEMDPLAKVVAAFHQKATVCPSDAVFGTPTKTFEPVAENFAQARPFLHEPKDIAQLEAIESAAKKLYQSIEPILTQRKQAGFIRACHGDMHSGNIVQYQQQAMVFDCIEFNEAFRWTDVAADVAFLMMDLEFHQHPGHAARFLSEYLIQTGDYALLQVLNYYRSYRAMVRAKIALLSILEHMSQEQIQGQYALYRRYANLAKHYTQPTQPRLIITCGTSGSGKSTLAQQIASRLPAVQIRSDIERKRLYGISFEQHDADPALYSPAMTQRTYERLLHLAELSLRCGYSVILDAAFLREEERANAHQLAKRWGVPFHILHTHADPKRLKQAIETRLLRGGDPSDATKRVLEEQLRNQEPLTDTEAGFVYPCDTNDHAEANKRIQQWLQHLSEATT